MGCIKPKGKVVIVGAGFVGASAAFAIATSGIANELVLIDVNKEKAWGEVNDLNHGLSFMNQMTIVDADYSAVKDADVIVITAGANRKPGETRLDLAKKNAAIVKDMVPQIMEHYNGGIIVVVSNPVDVLAYLIQKLSGLPAGKVISSGTLLDSSRFRYLIASKLGVDVKDVQANIIGEHGDSSVPVWSTASVAGEKLEVFAKELDKEAIAKEVVEAGAKVIQAKGATYYAIGLSIKTICEVILKNKSTVLPVGSLMDGSKFGISDVIISLPSVVNANGVAKVLDISLNDEEIEKFRVSASKLKEIIDQVV